MWQAWDFFPACRVGLVSEERMAVGAGVNALFTTSVISFGALWAESLPTTRLSTYVPSLAALNVGCTVLASVSAAGSAPFGTDTIDQAEVFPKRLPGPDKRMAPSRDTRSGPGSAIGRPGRSGFPLASRAPKPWPPRKFASV